MKYTRLTAIILGLAMGGCGMQLCEPEATMVKLSVDGVDFLIDRYEASRWNATADTAGTGVGVACNYKAALPWNSVTFMDARNACLDAGKRLCTKAEWIAACGQIYPYGSAYAKKTCNDDGVETMQTGARTSCATASGIYDMSGNVREWVEDGEGGALMGGGFNSEGAELACQPGKSVNIFSYSPTQADGFRCCQDVGIQQP